MTIRRAALLCCTVAVALTAVSPREQQAPAPPSARDTAQEHLWNPAVHADRTLAMRQPSYDVRVNGAFSHGGIDASTLVRTRAG